MRDRIFRDEALNFNFTINPSATRMTQMLISECFQLYQLHIQSLPSAGVDWTPVEKGLPEDEQPVLVTIQKRKDKSVIRAYYSKGKWHSAGGDVTVIAWTPLPDPY